MSSYNDKSDHSSSIKKAHGYSSSREIVAQIDSCLNRNPIRPYPLWVGCTQIDMWYAVCLWYVCDTYPRECRIFVLEGQCPDLFLSQEVPGIVHRNDSL